MQRLNQIHEKYKDKGLIVIGQTCWEREEGRVEAFVRSFGGKLSCRIALDDLTDSKQGRMVDTWLVPAGFRRIDVRQAFQAFLVDTRGVIAWIGRPAQLKESVIEAVLAGTFDVKKAVQEAAAKAEQAKARALKYAQRVTVKVGVPAPKLQTGKWVQGEPVTDFQKGKAYLLQFWEPYNRENRTLIPRLNEIHEKYQRKGLVVIGQNWGQRDDSQVESFLKQPGGQMAFRIALDDMTGTKRGKMAETWMIPAGYDLLPAAFLVDTQGLIAWIGAPTQLQESVIETVLDGTFDTKQAGEKAAAEAAQREKNMRKHYELDRDFEEAKLAGDWETAERTLAEMERLELPEGWGFMTRLSKLNMFLERKDSKGVNQATAELSEDCKDDAPFQNMLARQLLLDERIKERDLNLAEKIATRANTVAEGKDPEVLDTLARALFMNHKPDKAIEIQKQAVESAKDKMKDSLQATLDSYRKGQLPPPDPR